MSELTDKQIKALNDEVSRLKRKRGLPLNSVPFIEIDGWLRSGRPVVRFLRVDPPMKLRKK